MLYRVHLATLVVMGTDCTGSCKYSYHTISPTTTPSNRDFIPLADEWLCYYTSTLNRSNKVVLITETCQILELGNSYVSEMFCMSYDVDKQ